MLGINIHEIEQKVAEATRKNLEPVLNELYGVNEWLAEIHQLLQKIEQGLNSGS